MTNAKLLRSRMNRNGSSPVLKPSQEGQPSWLRLTRALVDRREVTCPNSK
jgi:hypothetical protein